MSIKQTILDEILIDESVLMGYAENVIMTCIFCSVDLGKAQRKVVPADVMSPNTSQEWL